MIRESNLTQIYVLWSDSKGGVMLGMKVEAIINALSNIMSTLESYMLESDLLCIYVTCLGIRVGDGEYMFGTILNKAFAEQYILK